MNIGGNDQMCQLFVIIRNPEQVVDDSEDTTIFNKKEERFVMLTSCQCFMLSMLPMKQQPASQQQIG